MLKVIDIHKQYERAPLLKGINFSLERGEVLCLLGSSGSGKSTLLRIIAGLEKPDRGKILWEGMDMENIPVHRRKFSLMFQEYALFPHRTVFQNVAFGLKMQGMKEEKIKEKVFERLESIGMRHMSERRVTGLSGGEQQRVAFARALAPDPRLLMLDDPLGALARTLRERLMEDLHALLKVSAIPTIYVTHDQQEAFALADRVILLNDGLIVQSGSPEEIYKQPASPWVARFLGFKNLLAGEVVNITPLQVKTALGIFQPGKRNPDGFYKVGQHVTLLVRPFGARPADDGYEEGKNLIEGTCEDQIFQGSGYRIKLRLLKELAFDFYMNQSLLLNQRLQLFLPPEEILCLAGET